MILEPHPDRIHGPKEFETEVPPELLGLGSLTPFIEHLSSSRGQMFGSHIAQMAVLPNGEVRMVQSGMEREMAKYTFAARMPCNGIILEVIPTMESPPGRTQKTPGKLVIYEQEGTRAVHCLRIPAAVSYHQYLGYVLRETEASSRLYPGSHVSEGTVFADSPSVTSSGDWKYGVNLNTAYATIPSVAEDGVVISRSTQRRLQTELIIRRIIRIPPGAVLLNTYGDDVNYKAFPDLGEGVRKDRLLVAFRGRNSDMDRVTQSSSKARNTIDPYYDNRHYAPASGGTVIDVVVYRDHSEPHDPWEHGQLLIYDQAKLRFCQTLVNWHRRNRDRELSPELSVEITNAIAIVNGSQGKVKFLHRNVPLTGFQIEITIKYTNTPDIGQKVTDTHGGKGVITAVWEDERMPVDKFGRVADLIQDPNGTFNRMIPGRKQEQYICDALWHMRRRVCSRLGLAENTKKIFTRRRIHEIWSSEPARIKECIDDVLGLYQILSPIEYEWLCEYVQKNPSGEDLLLAVVESMPTLYLPHDNRREMSQIIRMIRQSAYRPERDVIEYIPAQDGVKVTTVKPIRIAPVYFIVLDKMGNDWSACSLSPMGHHGVPAQLSEAMKYREPARIQGVRSWGETEMRLLTAYCSPMMVAEIIDRNGNPDIARHIGEQLLRVEKPSNVYNLVDRETFRYGSARPLAAVRHMFQCIGVGIRYRPYAPDWTRKEDK